MAKKRQKKNKRNKRRTRFTRPPGKSAGPQFVVIGSPGSPKDADQHIRYLAAHQYVPPGYPDGVADFEEPIGWALGCLDDSDTPSQIKLSAIMILAHTPDPRALEALRGYARAGGVHADMAELGADECAMWLGDAARTASRKEEAVLN